jgi:hypothetical protein
MQGYNLNPIGLLWENKRVKMEEMEMKLEMKFKIKVTRNEMSISEISLPLSNCTLQLGSKREGVA